MRTRLIEPESVAQGRAFGSHEGAQSRPTWARVERLVRPSGRAFLGDHRTALGGRGRAFRIGRDRGPAQAPFYGPPGARKRPQRPGRCVDHGPHRRFDPNRSSASLEADCLLAQQAGGLVDDAGSASTSTSVRRRSATSSRRLGFQSCNGPQTPAPRGPKRPNRDAERRFSHAVRFSAESANSFQSFRRLADVAAVPTIGEARCLLPFGGRVTALGGVAED